MMATSPSIDSVFERKEPQVKAIYQCLVTALKTFGAVNEAPKQTSIHLERSRAFAGVHPRKSYLNLEFRIDYKINDPRIVRHLQLSARRFEHTVKLANEDE